MPLPAPQRGRAELLLKQFREGASPWLAACGRHSRAASTHLHAAIRQRSLLVLHAFIARVRQRLRSA